MALKKDCGVFHDLSHNYGYFSQFWKYHCEADKKSFVYIYDMLGQPSQIESTEMFNVGRPSNFHGRWKK